MYLDSCILVKLLVPEPDSATLAAAVRDQVLVTSELAATEVTSALLARERAGALQPKDRTRAMDQWRRWVRDEEITLAPLDSQVLIRAARLLERCQPSIPLRTLDSIHLATADALDEQPFCTTDLRLRNAATHLGFQVVPTA